MSEVARILPGNEPARYVRLTAWTQATVLVCATGIAAVCFNAAEAVVLGLFAALLVLDAWRRR